MAKDINDLDYTVDVLFNMDGTKKYDRIDSVVRKSTNCTPTRNTRRKKQKPKEINELAKKAIIFVTLGAGLIVGANAVKDASTTFTKTQEVRKTIGSVVMDNTGYYGYNPNEERPYWDYNTYNMAEDILDKNKEYDIDTRIYGCYSNLNEYKKTEFMDEIFRNMSRLIGDSPEKYTEEEIKACLHSSFDEYLESKNITLEDYNKLMEKVIKAYVKEDKSQEEINNLLGELNGGSR